MSKDLRTFIEEMEREAPEHFLRISKEIDCSYEIPALLQHLEDLGKYPIVICENVKNLKGQRSKFPLITNVLASRERIATAIHSTVERIARDYVSRERNPVEPVVIPHKEAPVKEVKIIGKDVDLFELPIVTHHEGDIGPYFSAGDVWSKDPETGDVNCALLRMWAKEKNKISIYMNSVRHTYYYYQKYVSQHRPMPIAICLGHHPAFYIGAQTKVLAAELRTIGAMLGEPLELTPSETWGKDFYVPARAEIVIEAEVLLDKLEIEGPFGEFTGYQCGQDLQNVANIKAITHRKDAIYQDIFAGHRDHLIVDGPNLEAIILSKLREIVPTVQNVYLPTSGTARFHAYIQLKKTNDAEPKTIIAAALAAEHFIKHVWVVDDDVDIFNEQKVLWAMATRFQGDKDIVIIKDMVGSVSDPTVVDGRKTAKVGFDCTKPAPPEPFERTLTLPRDVLERVCLKDYISKEKFNTLKTE